MCHVPQGELLSGDVRLPAVPIERTATESGDRRAFEASLDILRQIPDYREAAEDLVKLAREKSLAREALEGLPTAPRSACIEAEDPDPAARLPAGSGADGRNA